MAELRALLVDDEPLARRGLRHALARHPDVVVCGECRDGREAVGAIRELRPQLVLLDVQMPELDGFGVLREVGADAVPAVIFTTAFDTFAVRAFDVHAVDYLVKPFEDARFDEALHRARQRLRQGEAAELGRRLADLLADTAGPRPGAVHAPLLANTSSPGGSAVLVPSAPLGEAATPGAGASPVASAPPADTAEPRQATAPVPPRPDRLLVKTGTRSVLVPVADIDWIEADDYCVTLHVGTQQHVLRESLAALEAQLDAERFVRIHRSAIVNVERIRELHHDSPTERVVVLATGQRLRVSRSRREHLERRLGRAR